MLSANRFRLLPWPANSPDHNPIEHVSDLFKRLIIALAQKQVIGSDNRPGMERHSTAVPVALHCVREIQMSGCNCCEWRSYKVLTLVTFRYEHGEV